MDYSGQTTYRPSASQGPPVTPNDGPVKQAVVNPWCANSVRLEITPFLGFNGERVIREVVPFVAYFQRTP